MRPGATGADGFTLIEILVALAVVAALGVVVVPLFHRSGQARAMADARNLTAALRITRAAAIAQNRAMTLLLDAERRTFGSEAVPASALDPRTEIGIEVADQYRSGFVAGIRFLPSGRSTGGRIRLVNGAFRTRLQVVWATGHVLLEE
jgi:general secretion pathway protein H